MSLSAQPSIHAQDLFGVNGLVAVVTGGAAGIGLMMTKALEANGATVFIIDLRQNKLDEAQKQAKHGKIIPIQGDVTSKTELARIVSTIASHPLSGGVVNLVVANVGIKGPEPPVSLDPGGPTAKPSLQEAYEFLWAPETADFNAVFATNVSATYYTAVAFLPLLDAGNAAGNVSQSSQIVITGSAASYSRVASSMFAYGASKAATNDLTRRLSTTLVPYHIRVNSIIPGTFPSENTEDLVKFFDANPEVLKEIFPVGRLGNTEDISGLILWLSSRAGSYVSGSIVLVDGGALSVRPASY
ncbi:hypothetical protein PFICI_13521 [Pestalotiopsis fici W106-1]|uniref:Uncharacterized protein n=1 Tax=Pestalotiopsis fici (strain W106-1 / CGMCC3.15140) TaxID=1229662 RepID=W3WPF7_PESFW|nr:uncharacterized protein PFICI_13521 [Pestalotiopsis fici W106-1]ETS75037.1 hypothetical protein PFICI_13521 [Pestalotiopsis fici W106-1]